MLCAPAGNVDVLQGACPATSATALQSVVAPSLNVTVPLGVPAPGPTAATVAVKVSGWPKTDGSGPVVRATVVVELALFTVCVSAPLVAVLKLASPL